MKLKKSHVSVSLLVLVLTLAVIGSINQEFAPEITLKTPKTSAGEITIVTPENKTYTQPDSGYYPTTYGFENDVENPELSTIRSTNFSPDERSTPRSKAS